MARDGEPALSGCCGPEGGGAAEAAGPGIAPQGRGDARWVSIDDDGTASVDLMIPGIRCAGCMRAVEEGLGRVPGIAGARVNLTLKRAQVRFDPARLGVDDIRAALDELGYEARPFDSAAMAEIDRDQAGRDLLARMGVAGFAAMNVMLLSVSVWSGAEAATRDLLHWISGLIALPAIVYSGQPFYRSAAKALSAGRLNMDVPITLAIVLAAGVSVYETALSGRHAYFDAGITLCFFLLIGRYLDHRTRARARSAAAELSALSARSATVLDGAGGRFTVAADELAPGMLIQVLPGERIPADGTVERGSSDLDRSLVTGESMPEPVAEGGEVHAGMLNLSGPLAVRATATGEGTLLSEIARMIEAAERGKTRYDRWADRAARLYAPGVHIVAGLAFLTWLAATGDWRVSIMTAAALLIITCPCALGLAVPAVHAVAGGALFRNGLFLKDGGALERLAEVDTVVFDKTGTLTDGEPRIAGAPPDDHPGWPVAAALAAASHHPLARALAAEARSRGVVPAELSELREIPGSGVEGRHGATRVRLGRADWVGAERGAGTAIWLDDGTGTPVAFTVTESLREDAPGVCEDLRSLGFSVVLLSGDASVPVAKVGEATGIRDARAGLTPAEKLRALEEMAAGGRTVLMVGDGLNDAPALAGAHVSMSPTSGADVSRTAADLVFTGRRLAPVLFAIRIARNAKTRALQNFWLAGLYNAVAVPVAFAGLVTPLIAALAMSGSSVVVTLNALRTRAQ